MSLKKLGILIIALACYLGVRYVGAEIHYACAVPEEDCPPPIRIMGDLGFYITGGTLVPLFMQDSPYIK